MTAPTDRWYRVVLLALCMWREAAGEGNPGMRAVGCVIINRTRAGFGSPVQVILGRNQFSSMSIKGDPTTVRWPSESDGAFLYALTAADELLAYEGTIDDPTNGALYYENPEVATSPWFISNIRGKMNVSARIGKHVFYSANKVA